MNLGFSEEVVLSLNGLFLAQHREGQGIRQCKDILKLFIIFFCIVKVPPKGDMINM